MAFDILILLLIVAMVFYKLKKVLGTRPDNETEISRESAAKIFDILMKETQKKQPQEQVVDGGELNAVNPNMSETDKTLSQITGFDKEKFLDGAERAFEIIIFAFAKGDTETLEVLLSKNLFKKFKEVIEQRKIEGISAETDFIGFEDAQIVDAKIAKTNLAKVSVKFVSEQVNILRNAKGEVLEGDENFIQSITDIWTFERMLSSPNPNWLLASTKK